MATALALALVDSATDRPWIVCQLGAREHYAIPRALHQSNALGRLITDAWVPPRSPFHYLPHNAAQSITGRYHADLDNASISSFTPSLISFELSQRLSLTSNWSSILARNQWFQRRTLYTLARLHTQLSTGQQPILFSYSYTALTLFRYAKQWGWRTVLGQIDPGIFEEEQVAKLQSTYDQTYQSSWAPAPEAYWRHWQQECQFADQIIVNSTWSQEALTAAGISQAKVRVIPLAYQPPEQRAAFCRRYPAAFTKARPLRVLFLGQIILRKGIAALLEAVPYLEQVPVEIWLVGSTELTVPSDLLSHSQLKWVGAVPRSEVQRYYQQADVFLFPTHSDGFGLTQLEAQAWQLPIIASCHCGEVVKHQQNGLILSEISGKSVADALLTCFRRPEQLKQWSQQSTDTHSYSLNQLAIHLQNLADDLV